MPRKCLFLDLNHSWLRKNAIRVTKLTILSRMQFAEEVKLDFCFHGKICHFRLKKAVIVDFFAVFARKVWC